jgi:hypothetical protein
MTTTCPKLRALALALSLAALLAAGGVACGDLGDPDASPAVLASFRGALTDMDGVEVEGELRVALIWRHNEADGWLPAGTQPYHIAEDVPVTTELPARFTLELTTPPPVAALRAVTADSGDTDFPPGSSYAVGALVVYDDRDGDGTLDLLDAGATEEIDRVVGARGDLEVWYVLGGVPRTAGQDGGGTYDFLQLGYQLVEWADEGGRLVTEADIPLTVAETLRSIVCADPFGAPFQIVMHEGGDWPESFPTDPETFECGADGLFLTWDRTGCHAVHWDTLCPTNVICPLDNWYVGDPAAPPEGWPCEVTWVEP